MWTVRIPSDGSSIGRPWQGQGRARSAKSVSAAVTPRADVIENTEQITIRLEMPGLALEDIAVEIDHDVLRIDATRALASRDDGVLYHQSELGHQPYRRSFRLSARLQRDAIDASYAAGILTISLPKSEESKPKKINVELKD